MPEPGSVQPPPPADGGRPVDPPIWREVIQWVGRYLTLVDVLMILALLGLVATFVAPMWAASARAANEWGALDFTKKLQQMQEGFKAKQPDDAKQYASTFFDLAAAGFELGDLPSGELLRGGYMFRIGVIDAARKKYFIMAMPERFGETGARSFYADDTGAVRESPGPVVGPAFPDATEPEAPTS